MRLNVTEQQCGAFTGGWSVCPRAIMGALNAIDYRDRLRILELGSGMGTQALIDLLDKLVVQFDYRAFENDERYVATDPRVKTTLWNGFEFPKSIEGIYDLVIVDGPNGTSRANWYPLLRDCCEAGTILLLDDYDHHVEFAKALNANFVYDLIDRQSGQHECWKTVRVWNAKR